MPTYEYKCEACGHEWEEDQRIDDPPVTKCPKCDKDEAKRQISQTSFVLMGDGWSSKGQ